MEKRLLNILRCPITHKSLAVARSDLLGRVNAAIADGKLHNHDGEQLTRALDEALVTEDGNVLYPIDDGIPVLLERESISLEQLE